ncbi:DUF4233 domain-containing protein [Agromyces sp. H66]|uniref:DUF4233 domain-containing protein n=1 Tax=Agromyces sp. H66 TaxID=2529859 RepID=UPI0020BE9261|nr:DUF4233 domain-containing protein [Agromyces sp. H66]
MSDTDPQPVPEPAAGPPRPARPARSARQTLGTMLLGFEVIVVFLAALVIWGLAPTENSTFDLPPWVALAAGGVLIVGLIGTIGLLRFSWGFVLGWVLQVLIIAAGFLNPAMFIVGAIFGGMWWYGMIAGARIDRDRTAIADPGKEQE